MTDTPPAQAHLDDVARAAGVSIERYEEFTQDTLRICTFPDGTKVAWFKDPDGNILSLTQLAPPQEGQPH